MKTKRRSFAQLICVLLVLCTLSIVVAQKESPEQQAKQILETTGIKGGLIVHIGCGDGKLTAALHVSDSYLVHGLDTDAANVEKAREHIREQDLYGPVTVQQWAGDCLPYAENLANLLVAEDLGEVAIGEVLRVLVPNGVAYVKTDGKWTKVTKPWPGGIDEWTHYLHGPDGNQVAADTVVGPPKHVKWLAKPYWGREHRYGNKTAMVSAQGRLFYVVNEVESSIELFPDRPFLIARDAFNGVLLWKHPIMPRPMKGRLEVAHDPEKYFLYEPMFPMELKVVAIENTLYLAFGREGEIQVLDAVTGQLTNVYDGTKHTKEILYYQGILLTVAAADSNEMQKMYYSARELNDLIFTRPRAKILRAINADSEKQLWEYDAGNDGGLKVSPVINGNRVFVVIGDDLVCLDIRTGKQVWNTPLPIDDEKKQIGFRSVFYIKGPSVYDHLIASDDVILLVYTAGRNPYSRKTVLDAFSTEKGKHIWSYECESPERAGASAFVVGDFVWVHGPGRKELPLIALDIRTGKEQKRFDAKKTFDIGHHHRCYGNRATERFILIGRRGVEFIDFDSGENWLHHWVRGKCRFGVLPCNGLLYSLPHACSCYPLSTFKGYAALAPEREEGKVSSVKETNRLEKGPVYGDVTSEFCPLTPGSWPTHRHDCKRSGSTPHYVKHDNLKQIWNTSPGKKLTGLTASDDRLFVCTPDSHQVHALDMNNGKVLWSYTAGSMVDSPPTLYNKLVLFGSADGYVYCLRANDGQLVWRFRAAPSDKMIVAYGRSESVWPVHGAVLVKDGTVYFSAGRSSLLDGGISVYALEPETGRVLAQNIIHDSYSKAEAAMLGNTGHGYEGNLAVLQDILVCDDTSIYLKQLQMNKNCVPKGKSRNLISTNGLLNPAWFSRLGWFFEKPTQESRQSNARRDKYDILKSVRQGQYLIFDDESTYSVKVHPNIGKFNQYFVPGEKGYQIFADDNKTLTNRWNIFVPIRVEAMVATAGKTLFVAGSPDIVDKSDPWGAIAGRKGGSLWAVSVMNGKTLAEYELDSPPVFDGMIAAAGQLYLSLKNGTVLCIGPERTRIACHTP